MTLKPFDWHLEMEKASANDCWDWVMRASGKALRPACIQLSLTSSQEQLDFFVPEERDSVFGLSVDRGDQWFSCVLNVQVTGKSASLDREWCAKNKLQVPGSEWHERTTTTVCHSAHSYNKGFHFQSICGFSSLVWQTLKYKMVVN